MNIRLTVNNTTLYKDVYINKNKDFKRIRIKRIIKPINQLPAKIICLDYNENQGRKEKEIIKSLSLYINTANKNSLHLSQYFIKNLDESLTALRSKMEIIINLCNSDPLDSELYESLKKALKEELNNH